MLASNLYQPESSKFSRRFLPCRNIRLRQGNEPFIVLTWLREVSGLATVSAEEEAQDGEEKHHWS